MNIRVFSAIFVFFRTGGRTKSGRRSAPFETAKNASTLVLNPSTQGLVFQLDGEAMAGGVFRKKEPGRYRWGGDASAASLPHLAIERLHDRFPVLDSRIPKDCRSATGKFEAKAGYERLIERSFAAASPPY